MSGSPIPRILGSPVSRSPGSIWQPWLPYSPIPRLAARTQLQCPWFPGSLPVHCCNVPGSPVRFGIPGCPIPRFAARALLQCLRFRIASQAAPIHARSRFKQVPDSPFTPVPRFPGSPVHHSPVRPRFLSSTQYTMKFIIHDCPYFLYLI